MKSSYLSIIGSLVIIASLIYGIFGFLTIVGVDSRSFLSLQLLSLFISVISLFGFKYVLNVLFVYHKSDRLLICFLSLSVLSFLVKEYMGFFFGGVVFSYFGFVVFLIAPIFAFLFHLSLLRLGKPWVSVYAVIGLLIYAIGILEQFSYIGLLLHLIELLKYVNNIFTFVFVFFLKVLQWLVLGGALIWSGIS